MRPDEHKKKKNAAYKKKHGIGASGSSNNTSSAVNNATGSKSKQEKNKNKSGHDSGTHSVSKNVSKTDSISGDSSRSDSESEVVEKRKTYRRRDVVSNWRKYELEPDGDEPVKSRGEDFSKLLNMAGEAMSHFRFKDEIEWEEDLSSGVGDGGEQNPVASNFLSLDLTDISSSMACIPIHQILGIDQSLFPADQLESHLQSARENRILYNNTIQQREEQSRSNSCEISNITSNSGNDFKDIPKPTHQSKHKLIEGLKNNSNACESGGNKIKQPKTDKLKECSTPEVQDRTVEKEADSLPDKIAHNQSHAKQSMCLEDDDLDQFLDMDVRHDGKNGKLTVEDSSRKSNEISPTKNLPITKKDEKKEADELEDWLDSILD